MTDETAKLVRAAIAQFEIELEQASKPQMRATGTRTRQTVEPANIDSIEPPDIWNLNAPKPPRRVDGDGLPDAWGIASKLERHRGVER